VSEWAGAMPRRRRGRRWAAAWALEAATTVEAAGIIIIANHGGTGGALPARRP